MNDADLEKDLAALPSHRRELARLGLEARSKRRVPGPSAAAQPPRPPDWPSHIHLELADFRNWSREITVCNLWKAVPRTAEDVVTIANWASTSGYKVRAVGKSHNWSPLVVQQGEDPSSFVLVSTEKLQDRSFSSDPAPRVTLGAGVTINDATAFLQAQPGNTVTTAPGYTFLNVTAPGDLTIGGVLAVGGHGTGIPVEGEPDLDGCMTNLVTSFTAVVSDGSGRYGLRTFSRADPDAAALLVHLGRAFVTEMTLAVVPDYHLQVTNRYPSVKTLFEAPGSAPASESLAQLVETYGRVEVIWFPFTDHPWVKTWQRVPHRIDPQVSGPYNYPWAMDIEPWVSNLIADGLRLFPHLTPWFAAGELIDVMSHAWPGAQLNGTARDLLLYVKPTTALVGMAGYAVQVPLDGLQAAANTFFVKFQSLLVGYRDRGRYPTNGAVEMRVTTVDRLDELGIPEAEPPALSACAPIGGQSGGDVVFWFDSLTFPGTQDAGAFYQELEEWLAQEWGWGTLRAEWSKGWAYTQKGPWTNAAAISSIQTAYPRFAEARRTLARYDAADIYSNTFLGELLPSERPATP